MEKLAEVSESEIRIDFALGRKCRASVILSSLTPAAPVAFKVQTSSPHKFLVNQPAGLIPPLSTITLQVILKPQSHLPSTYPRSPSDRFLIKTALASDLQSTHHHHHPEFINSWFNLLPNRPTRDLKLKVAFVGPFLLHHAVSLRDINAVRSIIKRQRSLVAALSTQEAHSLYDAAVKSGRNRDNDMLNLLVEAGLKIGTRTTDGLVHNGKLASKGWTELHAAAAFNRTDEVERIVRMKEHGSLDCRDKEGRTPLHLAASKGHLDCAKLLLGAGVHVDARSEDGRTALFRAAANGDRPMVELLIEMHADPRIADKDLGRSAIDVARDKGHDEIVQLLGRGEAVLHAARRGELKLLESLLGKGASPDFCDEYGLTALHMAALKGHKDAVIALVEFGAALECQDAEGHTPLHLAVEGGCFETTEVLINRGADVNTISKKGATPLYISRMMGYDDISRLLIRKGATSSPSSMPS